MLFMVVERFKNRDAKAVYQRLRERGRMMPEGLRYVDSWVETNFDRCFQLMECEDPLLFREWIEQWEDLMEFEIVPVITSKEAVHLTAQTP
ncbi:MAG TPA: DUF3303 family protein [Pyrinomonadaceae bacterium]|nr:DUF3303 family protein [Pyrinomonadaceae bacterium]